MPKKLLHTVGEIRKALEPFGDDTSIMFHPLPINDPGDLLWAHRVVIEDEAIIVELLPFFEAAEEEQRNISG